MRGHEVQEGTVERTSWRGKKGKGVKERERGEREGTKYRKGRLKGLREGESEGKG